MVSHTQCYFTAGSRTLPEFKLQVCELIHEFLKYSLFIHGQTKDTNFPAQPECSKYPSSPIPEKTTVSSLPRSQLRKKTAELLRTRHAPTPPKRVGTLLALLRHVKHSSRLAVIVAQESAEPLVTFDDSALQPKTTALSVAYYCLTLRG